MFMIAGIVAAAAYFAFQQGLLNDMLVSPPPPASCGACQVPRDLLSAYHAHAGALAAVTACVRVNTGVFLPFTWQAGQADRFLSAPG